MNIRYSQQIAPRRFQQEGRRDFMAVTGDGRRIMEADDRGAFAVLTLVRTRRVPRIPIVLFGGKYWRRAVNSCFLVEEGMIGDADAALFALVERAEEAVAVLHDLYQGTPPP